MPAPKAIVCHLCNGKYFSRSYPIHLKQCEAKWKKTHSRCEYCGAAVANTDWSDHRSHCKPSKKKKLFCKEAPLKVPKNTNYDQELPTLSKNAKAVECEECGTEMAMWQCQECEQSLCAMCEVDLHRKGARMRHTRIPLNAKALHAKNMSISATTNADCKESEQQPAVQQDHRTECKFCGRRFNPDRVEKHMRICNVAKKKGKRRKTWDGPAKRIENTDFAQYEFNRSATPEKVKEWKKNGRRWRAESSQLRQIAVIDDDLEEIKQKKKTKKKKKPESKEEEENNIWTFKAKPMPKFKSKPSCVTNPKPKTQWKPPTPPVVEKSKSSSPSISGASSSRGNINKKKQKKEKIPAMKGSSIRVGQRSATGSNKSSNSSSAKSSARRYVSKFDQNQNAKRGKAKNGSTNSYVDRVSRRKATKKPGIPKFSRRKSGSNEPSCDDVDAQMAILQSLSLEPKKKAAPKTNFKANPMPKFKSKAVPNTKPKPKMQSKPDPVPKMNNRNVAKSKPTFKRTKSEANSLARGCELGNNVKKMFDNEPTGTMDDYVERERIRRQKRSKNPANTSSAGAYKPRAKPKPLMPIQPMAKAKSKKKSIAPSNARERLQMRKDMKEMETQKIGSSGNANRGVSINKLGGNIANKPKGSRELAFKRAAYFESLMQNQED